MIVMARNMTPALLQSGRRFSDGHRIGAPVHGTRRNAGGQIGALGSAPAHPEEERFLASMASPERLREYHERTRENIQILLRWMQEAEAAVPLERYRIMV